METGDSPRTVPTDGGMLLVSLRLDSRGLMSAIAFGNSIPCRSALAGPAWGERKNSKIEGKGKEEQESKMGRKGGTGKEEDWLFNKHALG